MTTYMFFLFIFNLLTLCNSDVIAGLLTLLQKEKEIMERQAAQLRYKVVRTWLWAGEESVFNVYKFLSLLLSIALIGKG